MKGSGGTDGGVWQFLLGLVLCLLALWFFLDSVHVTSGHMGVFGGMMGRGGGNGSMMTTTSMGIIFVPFFIGVVALFYNSRLLWAWILMWVGVAIIVIEILSRLRFQYIMKSTSLLMMIVMFAAGAGLMLRSYRQLPASQADTLPDKKTPPDEKPAANENEISKSRDQNTDVEK